MNSSDIEKQMKEEGLRYVNDKSAGWFRQKVRSMFSYYNTKGEKITDEEKLARIKSLVIPPAWEKVWISPRKNGHIQATGIDEKGRKQYIYHPDWIKIGQEKKFSKMIDFGLSLPLIRQKISHDLKEPKLDREKIIATIIWLLEHTFIRIGNEEYSKENNSFGLTTLRNKHVTVNSQDVVFQFRGKSGVHNTLEVTNPTIVRTIKKCVELPGYELFQYIDEDNNRHTIDSSDVNEFLKDITKNNFTAKDFRTWGGSNLSANNFYKLGNSPDKTTLKKNITETVKKVSEHLNNTVAVCRSYYIHPTVFKTYQSDVLVPHFSYHQKSKSPKSGLSWDEYALIALLKKYQ